LADLATDDAVNRGTTYRTNHRTNPATSGKGRTANGTCASAGDRVLL